MDDDRFINSRSMFVKVGTCLIPGKITGIRYIIDVNTGEHRNARSLQKNELALCSVELSSPAVLDTFTNHRTLGELILIDRVTNATSACGVIETIIDSHDQRETEVSPEVSAKYMGQTPFLILASDARKAGEIEMELLSQGMHTMRLCVSGERLIFTADILQRAGLITVISGDYLDRETEVGLRKKLYSKPILDLRESGPEKDRLLYENMVNYVFL
jgi:sulfate adenylyltransferase subunit 1